MKIEDVLEKVDEKVIFNKPYGIVKIPEEYFRKKLAMVVNDNINVLGIFTLEVFDSYDADAEEKRGKGEKFLFSIPTSVVLSPSNMIEEVDEGSKIMLLEFFQGDVFFPTTKIVQGIQNVENAFNLLFNNYIPKGMSYPDIANTIEEATILNKINLKASALNIELLVMALVRDHDQLDVLFRQVLASDPKRSLYDFRVVRLLDAAKYNDAFSALTSSNPMLGTINSIKDSKEGKPAKTSPVEESIK